jgi:hypothetical protein
VSGRPPNCGSWTCLAWNLYENQLHHTLPTGEAFTVVGFILHDGGGRQVQYFPKRVPEKRG